MAILDRESIEFARNHVRNFYDSDFLPKPFEFDALWADWPRVVDYLTGREVADLPAPRPRLIAAPKPAGSYRIVHQLDPLSTLIYTALTYRVAPQLEAARMPVGDRVSCAYRVELNHDRGRFFGTATGYESFIERCHQLAGEYPYVLVADIADFYNQIYIHRLQNVIATAAPESGDYANAIEDYLMALNGRVSKGIPVGPAASIVMAEAVLNDLDHVIRDRGFKHTRYVDDIRVFAAEWTALDDLLQEITKYLYETHRLTIASHKTETVSTQEFVERFLQNPDALELQAAHARLRGLATRVDAYSTHAGHSSGDAPQPADPTVIQALMHLLCATRPLDLGLARHVLRKCRQYRIRSIVPKLFENFSFFAPVMPAVILYLHRVSSKSFVDRNVQAVADLYAAPATRVPFVRLWLDNYTSAYPEFLAHETIRHQVMNSPSVAAQASGALVRRDVAWVRRHKPEVDLMGPFDRRQVMRASLVLAPEERTPWLRNVLRNHTSVVDQAVVQWLLAH